MPDTMSKPKMILGLLGAFLVGCIASQMTALIVPPARAGTSPQKWEYACKDTGGSDDVANMANSFGAEGWDMASAAARGNWMTWCFKRPLP
jgi:hypothetical protein